MSGFMEKLGLGQHPSSSDSSHSSSSTSSIRSDPIYYNAEGKKINPQERAFAGSAANLGAPGPSADPTRGTTRATAPTAYESSRPTAGYGKTGYAAATGTTGTTDTGMGDENPMTRPEERMHAGKERERPGEGALYKTVGSERVCTQVPMMKETITLYREPMTEANRDAALHGSEPKGSGHGIRTEENPSLQADTASQGRARLDKRAEVENKPAGGEFRKQQMNAPTAGAPSQGTSAGTGAPTYYTDAPGSSALYNKERVGTDLTGATTDLYNKDRIGANTGSDLHKKETQY